MTLDKLTTVLNKGGQHLGDKIWWTLSDAKIDRSTLENIWASARLAPEYLPYPPTAEKALKAAVREAAVGQPDRLIRLGKEDEAEIVVADLPEVRVRVALALTDDAWPVLEALTASHSRSTPSLPAG